MRRLRHVAAAGAQHSVLRTFTAGPPNASGQSEATANDLGEFVAALPTSIHRLHHRFQDLGLPSVEAWATRLDVGEQSLRAWRSAVRRYNDDLAAAPAASSGLTMEDADLLRWFVTSRRGLLSPFLTLGVPTVAQNESSVSGTTLVARRTIEPGMFLCSMPRDSVLAVAVPPPTPDDKTQTVRADSNAQIDSDAQDEAQFLTLVDCLAARLLTALARPSDDLHPYAHYLMTSVATPRNLAFVGPSEFTTAAGRSLATRFAVAAAESPQLRGHPSLREVDEAHYRWACSHVLARRFHGTMMLPVIDKANHNHDPNAFYTLCDEENIVGLDVVDNVFSGVGEDRLYEPHVHLFALQRIRAGAPVVLSYFEGNPRVDPEAADAWRASWGFIPDRAAVISDGGIRDMATMIVRRRIALRKSLFPPS